MRNLVTSIFGAAMPTTSPITTSTISISISVNPNAKPRAHVWRGPEPWGMRLLVCDCRVMTEPSLPSGPPQYATIRLHLPTTPSDSPLRSLKPSHLRCNGNYEAFWSLLTTNPSKSPEYLKPLEQQAPAARTVRRRDSRHVERLNDRALRIVERRVTAQAVELEIDVRRHHRAPKVR